MKKEEIYKIGKKLGMSNIEINQIFNNNEHQELIAFSAGPDIYIGTHYGTVSIKDFAMFG